MERNTYSLCRYRTNEKVQEFEDKITNNQAEVSSVKAHDTADTLGVNPFDEPITEDTENKINEENQAELQEEKRISLQEEIKSIQAELGEVQNEIDKLKKTKSKNKVAQKLFSDL